MDDLINEDEFLPKAYNPWKNFILFSVLSACFNIGCLYSTKFFEIYHPDLINPILCICVFVSAPLFSVFAVFTKKEMYSTKPENRNYGIGLVYIASYLAFMTLAMIAHFMHEVKIIDLTGVVAGIFLMYAVNYGITALIVHYIIKRILKKQKRS